MTDVRDRFTANPDQAAHWNGPAGQKWVDHDAAMDVRLRPLTDELLRRAAVRPGERILDVGCGAGITAERLVEAVGPDGRVLGIDLSEAMLGAARERCRAYPNVAFEQADAQVHPFPDAGFDRLFSRFGVMFFTEPRVAFANLARATVPDGRLDFVCWAPVELNPWFTVPMSVAVRHLGPPAPTPPRTPGPLAFSDPDYVRDILRDAGFRELAIETFETVMIGPESPEEQAALYLKLGPASRLIAAVEPGPEVVAAIHEELAAELSARAARGSTGLDATVYLVGARR